MSEPLHLKYRPRSFKGMIGQSLTGVVLQQMASQNKVPTGLLFSGPSGTGKTSAARILAKVMNVEDLDIIEIDAARNSGVAEVRDLTEKLRYSTGGEHRVIILDEAHSMSRDAFNALLKTLEEPPAGTIFILVTTEPERVPDVIMTRLMEFQFKKVSTHDIYKRLAAVVKREEFVLEESLLKSLAERAEGGVRSALVSLDQVTLAGITTLEEYAELLGERDTAPTLLAAALTGNAAHMYEVLDEQLAVAGNPHVISAALTRCVRDLMVLRAGGTLPLMGAPLDIRTELAQKIEADRLLAVATRLWELKTKIRVSDDPRGNLELALMLISDVLSRGKVASEQAAAPSASPAAAVAPEAAQQLVARKLSLDEIQQRKRG